MEFQSFYIKLFVLVCLVAESIQGTRQRIVSGSSLQGPTPRIVGGTQAAVGQFPYQVSVRVNGKHICGGALVAQGFVVTAAHCVVSIPSSFLSVQAGTIDISETGVVSEISKVTPHPDYYYDNDIAVLELSTPFNYSDVVRPIPLANIEAPAGEEVTISGWGRTTNGGTPSQLLRYSRSLTILSDKQCARIAGPLNPGIQCLSKEKSNGFCDGDDGGPAVHKGVLIGIASYYSDGCGSASPDGYTKISYYREWLDENTVTPTVPVLIP
ncbi:serine protease SP24D [Bactrocera dorsalis]|uniref:Serine protease SP24D n=1 Tax=Bactrocera dorsalis TaxID=27457 RepID=A0A6I9V1W9_BACDO|nr:serine protease SP24D [Bactrocera dorsalis]